MSLPGRVGGAKGNSSRVILAQQSRKRVAFCEISHSFLVGNKDDGLRRVKKNYTECVFTIVTFARGSKRAFAFDEKKGRSKAAPSKAQHISLSAYGTMCMCPILGPTGVTPSAVAFSMVTNKPKSDRVVSALISASLRPGAFTTCPSFTNF